MTSQPTSATRWLRRLKRMSIAAAVLFLGQLLYAIGDTGGPLGQTPPTLSWITLHDDKGINAWQYELSINQTADVFDLGGSFAAVVVDFMWGIYKALVMIAIWFLDWVFSFDWLTIITGPLLAIGDALRDVFTSFGLAPTFLLIAAFVAGIAMLRGKFAQGIYEMLMAALVVAISTTVLANPVMMIAGPDGWIYQTRDRTMELVAAMGNQSSSDANAITSQLVQIFIRQPVQLISFGQVLDGTSCESVYDDVVAAGPYGKTDDIRNAVAACSPEAGQFAESPSGGMVTAVMMQSPASGIVLVLAVIIGGAVMLALINAALAGIRLMINLVFAVLPGGARRPLAQSFAEVGIALTTFVFALFFLTVFLQIISTIFKASNGEPSKAFLVVNVFMVMGLVMFIAWRRKFKAATERWTEWMMRRPGGAAPRPLPSGGGRSAATMATLASYGAFKVLKSRQGRQTVKNVGTLGLAAATGNPALAGKVLFTAATKKATKRGLGGAAPTAGSPTSPKPDQAPAATPPTTQAPRIGATTRRTNPRHRSATTSSSAQLHNHASRGESIPYRDRDPRNEPPRDTEPAVPTPARATTAPARKPDPAKTWAPRKVVRSKPVRGSAPVVRRR